MPLRIECGPRDLQNEQVIIKLRDESDKKAVPFADFIETIESELTTMQTRLLTTARAMNQANYHTNINTLDELVEHIETKRAAGELPGWVLAGWDGTEESEAKIKELTGFTTRNIPFAGQVEEKTTCIVTGQPAKHTVWLARAY